MSKTQAKPILSENIEIILKIKLICRNMRLRLEYAITAITLKICICICAYAFSKNPGPSNQQPQVRFLSWPPECEDDSVYIPRSETFSKYPSYARQILEISVREEQQIMLLHIKCIE
jgi:hypothetical protein